MALIVFIENREKTYFWERVALRFRSLGHDVAWLVQNPQFVPRAFADDPGLHVIPFPPRHVRAMNTPHDDAWVRQHFPSLLADRGRRHQNAGSSHYGWYISHFERLLREIEPDFVIGEATLFHELIAIDRCRAAGISYIHPAANRYPARRFSLFAYDSQHPVARSGDSWSQSAAYELSERIATGREVPFYMRTPGPFEKTRRRLIWAATRGRVWWGRVCGERYNTPSLPRKLALTKYVRANLTRWEKLERLPRQPARTLMYPLQMQPENTIDAWGQPFTDQIAIIKELLAAAPPDVQIALKANPKASYETSDELLALAANEDRICLLPLKLNMIHAHQHCLGAVTVTGTVGYEAIFGKGRTLSLCHPLIEREFPLFHAANPTAAVDRLLNDSQAGVGNIELGARLIQLLVAESYPGLISDPLSDPECLAPDNIAAVADAFHRLATLKHDRGPVQRADRRELQAASGG